MSEFTHFSPRDPESFVVSEGKQTLIATRSSEFNYTVLYVSNNGDNPVYLGFTGPKSETGNAAVNKGITVFPKSVMIFDDPVPTGCKVWATCETGSVVLGVQQ